MDADFDSADVYTKQLRDVFVLHFLISSQHKQFTFVLGQFQQGSSDHLRLLIAFELLARERTATWNVHALLGKADLASMLLEMIEPSIARDVKHPGPEMAFVAIGLPIFQYAEE